MQIIKHILYFIMLKVMFVFLCFILSGTLISGQENIGDPCEVEEENNVPGTCQHHNLCDYAYDLVNEEKKKPTICYLNTSVTLVCCPNKPEQTGYLGRAFMDSIEGKITSNEFECRYDGSFPMICCKRKPVRNRLRLEGRFVETCRDNITQAACEACYEYAQPPEDSKDCRQGTSLKIAGGENTDILDFPHMVALGCKNTKKVNRDDLDILWVGAGSLISPTYVLTAAHVLQEPTYGIIKYALLGTSNKMDLKSGIIRNVNRRIPHKSYRTTSHNHDIALVELDYEVPFSKFIRPACLPVTGVAPDPLPTSMIVVGWGKTGQHLNTSMTLKKGDLNVLEAKECNMNVKATNFKWDEKTMICATSTTADTCEGDSGGPLMVPLNMRSRLCGHLVAGVVSWGPVCGVGKVSSFTKVSNPEYLKWIISTVWPDRKRA